MALIEIDPPPDPSSLCDALAAELDELDSQTDAMEEVWTDRPPALARLVERAESGGCEDLARRLRWEAMLACSYTSNAALLDSDKPRFIDVHPNLLQDDALDYLLTRTAAASAYVRSRVLDFLWVHGGPTRRRNAIGAGAAFIEVAALEAGKVTLDNFAWLHAGDALVRAAELAKAANQPSTIRAVAEEALRLLQRLNSEGTLRFVLDMGHALVVVATHVTAAEREIVDSALSEAAAGFAAVDDYHLARAAMSVRRRFAVGCKQPDAVLRAIDIEIARSSLQEGEQRESEGNALVASVAFGEALELFERIGSERALTEAARAAVRRTREAGIGEMVRISTGPIHLSAEHQAQIELVIQRVATAAAPDCFRLFALHPSLLVTREAAEASVAEMRRVAPLSYMMPRVILRGGGQVLAPADPAEAERLRLYQAGVRLLRLQDGFYLNSILERLIARDDLDPEAMLGYLTTSGHIPAESIPVIQVGIDRMWERDWVSALHILVPQLEEVMRTMLRRAGHETMRPLKAIPGVTVEAPLATVLDHLAAVILDDGVIFMLDVVLDLYGLNLRNIFTHGLINIGDCCVDNVVRVLQLYLILGELRPSPRPTPRPDAE